LWSNPDTQKDPFINLNETQLRTLLNSGSAFGGLSKGLLEPQVQELERQGGVPRYSVVCCGAPIEELLARLVANTVLDINWAFNPDSVGIRKRPVNVYLQGATTHQLVTTAAGCVGLLARQSAEGRIDIFNPEDYCSLSEHKQLLNDEAILLWQKFLLAFHNDERIGNAHFALGLLQSQKGLDVESIAEYKLVANRFSKTSLAPFALFHSSKLKAALRDYSGARQDLKQLVEQYPHTEIADQAYLYLAETTAKMGLKTEAARLYRKVYNLGLSSESQSVAAVRAGRCFYEIKDYESAEKWLSQYISLVKNNKSKDWCSAYFLLGKTNIALGKHQQGCDAFRHALKGHISREEYIETVSALVGGYMEQGHFVQALDVLEDIHLTAFSEKESVEISLLKSRILRAMGLIDKAISILGDKAEYTSDPQLKAKISLELTDCHIAKGNLEPARRKLTKILAIIKPGPLAQETALKLADVCLKLGQNSQSISICSQLLDSAPSERIRQKTLKILAIAYNQQKNYDKAALALLGQWK
jgi:tetratricopeptide (TPR) repeat protein